MKQMILALILLALPVSVAQARSPSRYEIQASISPDGDLTATTTLTLAPHDAGQTLDFLLGERFVISRVDAVEGAQVSYSLTDKPVSGLRRVRIVLPRTPAGTTRLVFHYSGPLNRLSDEGSAFSPGAVELRLETFWIPVRSDIALKYAVTAHIAGLSPDLVPISQGQVRRRDGVLEIKRESLDIDTPLVAVRGLRRTATEGMEFYGPPRDDPLTKSFRSHSAGAAAFLQAWLGPLPQGPVRIVVIGRVGGSSYARRGYIVIARPRPDDPDKTGEVAHARHVAHEFAHAWFQGADPLTEHYWLAESLAEYCAVRYAEAAFGETAKRYLLTGKRERARTAGPIMGAGRPSRDALYQKGPLLLFDLEARIGRPRMDRLLARLAAHPPRLTSDFLQALADIADQQAARAFEEDLRT